MTRKNRRRRATPPGDRRTRARLDDDSLRPQDCYESAVVYRANPFAGFNAPTNFGFSHDIAINNMPPSSAEYRMSVLLPHGIKIRDTPKFYDANDHFDSNPTHNNFHRIPKEDGELSAHGLAEVWVSPSLLKDFVQSYNALLRCPHASIETKKAEVMSLLFRQTSYGLPPHIWSYWIQTLGFGRSWSESFIGLTMQLDNRIILPYLTIEFWREGDGEFGCVNRMARNAGIALYNRYILREMSVNKLIEEPTWDARDTGDPLQDIKHYGIVMSETGFTVRVFLPDSPGTAHGVQGDTKTINCGNLTGQMRWTGCTAYEMMSGTLRQQASVWYLLSWVNEIHRWAIGAYAPGCARDIDRCMAKRQR
ncbi:hypothetical protein MCOR27_005099 [Pyricularia oryzae]|uniref:Uncharacterized protein n=1 Tax=Pyricularia grisea TaxID=148305 RepID=A0ABQ8NF51_PYRGI|nr:hypothetical protein MCOR02_007867 [Pyricularia oryzae]KAI6296042.1 hypothetical protein MCOR33_007240 [Pyricularia grisea]KAI6258071.1 hypothetical protein MCOR19_005521 [Pyricularia oryzae]KAI6279555.1 hypothetical protein MCOR27_005099 [Pyricularia oryzae]KAI6293174.1 hypothetical protein MCOR34_009914 [Pyricularia oryzae]